jgi:hypothetical protein
MAGVGPKADSVRQPTPWASNRPNLEFGVKAQPFYFTRTPCGPETNAANVTDPAPATNFTTTCRARGGHAPQHSLVLDCLVRRAKAP